MEIKTRSTVKVNGYSNKTRNAKSRRRQYEADSRQAAYDMLSVKQKLANIESRPGESKKEKNRIQKSLEK